MSHLAYHFDEILQEQLDRINMLNDGEEEPTEYELKPPKQKINRKTLTRKEFLEK